MASWPGKNCLREALADEDHVHLLPHLAVCEHAAAHERNPHDAEVAVVADADLGPGLLAGKRDRPADDPEARRGGEPGERRKAHGPGVADPGKPRCLLDGLREEAQSRRVLLIPVAAERDARGEHTFALESRMHAAEGVEALEHEPGADEQDGRERDLGDDESLPQRLRSRAGATRPGAVLQGLLDVGPRAGECRREAAEPRGQDRDERREAQDGGTDLDERKGREVGRAESDEQGHAPARDEQAHGATDEREEQVLRQELREDPRAARPEGRADRHLPHARGAPGEEEPGHVGAGDEEHEPDGAEQDEERRSHLARDLRV